jgi:hypothetical protein
MDKVDLYFFAVQVNPIDNQSLMALFPVSEPPWACVAAAFSLDGVRFSSPVNILNSRVAFRQHTSHSSHDRLAAGFSARAEDHPVANIVPDPLARGMSYLLYIHHAVHGISYRRGGSHVTAYALPTAVLRRWTTEALHELKTANPARLVTRLHPGVTFRQGTLRAISREAVDTEDVRNASGCARACERYHFDGCRKFTFKIKDGEPHCYLKAGKEVDGYGAGQPTTCAKVARCTSGSVSAAA